MLGLRQSTMSPWRGHTYTFSQIRGAHASTAYKIGMINILELREDARERLGEAFDIRDFHDIVRKDGPVPLQILEENVEAWIRSQP